MFTKLMKCLFKTKQKIWAYLTYNLGYILVLDKKFENTVIILIII